MSGTEAKDRMMGGTSVLKHVSRIAEVRSSNHDPLRHNFLPALLGNVDSARFPAGGHQWASVLIQSNLKFRSLV